MILNGDTLIVRNAATARLKLGLPQSNSDFGFPTLVIPFLMDGGGSVITTGSKGWVRMPGDITFTGWEVFADASGSIEVDILRSTYANLPAFASIAGTDLPTLTAAQKNQSQDLTGWTRAVNEGDYIEFVVNSASTVERAVVVLVGLRTS